MNLNFNSLKNQMWLVSVVDVCGVLVCGWCVVDVCGWCVCCLCVSSVWVVRVRRPSQEGFCLQRRQALWRTIGVILKPSSTRSRQQPSSLHQHRRRGKARGRTKGTWGPRSRRKVCSRNRRGRSAEECGEARGRPRSFPGSSEEGTRRSAGVGERIQSAQLFLERKQKRVEKTRPSSMQGRGGSRQSGTGRRIVLTYVKQRFTKLFLEAKAKLPLFVGQTPSVVPDGSAELSRMQGVIDDLQRKLTRLRAVRWWIPVRRTIRWALSWPNRKRHPPRCRCWSTIPMGSA